MEDDHKIVCFSVCVCVKCVCGVGRGVDAVWITVFINKGKAVNHLHDHVEG